MSSFSPSKPKWSARMGSVMRRTSSVFNISRPTSAASERDTDNSSLSSSTRSRANSNLSSPPLPAVVTPSPIAESPLREAAAEAQEDAGRSPLAQPVTSSEVVPPTLPPSVEETPPPPPGSVIDSTVGNLGAFTDVIDYLLPQPDVVQDPQAVAVAPVDATPNPAEIVTEALVDEPTSDFVEPLAEGISDLEPVDHVDITTEFSDDFDGNANVISPDPFSDPIAPRISRQILNRDIPLPEFAAHQGPAESSNHGLNYMPLPSFDDVIASMPSSKENGNTGNLIETNERLPLLSRPAKPFKHLPSSYLQKCPRDLMSISSLVHSTSQSTTSNGDDNSPSRHPHHPKLHFSGWLEYHLEDGTVYYVHPTNKVTTEINLRNERMLTGVERFLADYSKDQSGVEMEGTLTPGGEIWLGDVGTVESGLVLERWWVDHRLRTVVMDDEHEHARKGSAKGKAKMGGTVFHKEDRLDTEYRYWSFMEAHPAHNSLPQKAKMEAMDMLTWAWTEHPLSTHRVVPPPFTQEECQELTTLLRSFSDGADEYEIQTRTVSRVFRRVVQWRQKYFRPNKPLPANVCSNQPRFPITPRQPFKWFIIDIIVSCLFLGIPYIFFERTRLSTRIADEESGLRYATPTHVLIGAYTCLVAVVILSASVIFLSLPGLDAFSRITAMVAILFTAFSMAATVVAIFRHKADLELPISHRRTVILSLPLILLVCSIVAFITASF